MENNETQSNVERIDQKLDQILVLLHGDDAGSLGLVQKVNFIWTVIFKWPLYLVSIVMGSVVTILIQHFAK